MEAFKNGWLLEVCVYCSESALGIQLCSTSWSLWGGRGTVIIHIFLLYLTNHLSFGAQWASERAWGFIGNFCYVEYLSMLSRSRISELSEAELSLQNVKWWFKMLLPYQWPAGCFPLVCQFSLQEVGISCSDSRLLTDPSPHQGCGKTVGLRKRW